MTDFVGCYLTTAGLELSAKSGVNIVFTRAETGSGVYTSPEGVKDLVGLKHKQYDHELEDVEIKGELADVIFYVTNKGVTEEYKLTEIGIYARAEGNEEILYCIVFAYEENAETIDAETAGQITYCRKFCIETKISADANVAVQIVGTDHEWAANYFIKYAGQVDLEAGTLQEQIKNHTHKAMTGATETQSGRGGFVPKPDAGQQSMALFGDGKFKRIEDEINTEYDEPENMEKLTSGEKFKNLLGKLSKAVSVIFEKLDVSRVVNNNTTTESGFALDARQANPTIEGTMANQILQLNNDSKSERFVETSELLNGCEGWLRYTVRNGICYANLWPIRSPNEAVNILVYDKMPKPAIYCGAFSNVLGNTIFAFIDAGTPNLKVHINAAAYTYVSFSYPVEL